MLPPLAPPPPSLVAPLLAPTRKVDLLPLAALLQDAVAVAEMTREMPAQSLPVPIATPKKLPFLPELADAPALPRPPPLPPRGKPIAAVAAPQTKPRAVAQVAPPPKLMRVLDDPTIPGMAPVSSSTSQSTSQSGRVRFERSSDSYRLQEFEDTPARPLPALASLVPMPVEAHVLPGHGAAPIAEVDMLAGVQSTDLNRLDELEAIADLDSLARALGLKSVVDVSIPSDEGEPVVDPLVAHLETSFDASLPPRQMSAVRRAAVMKALGEDEGTSQPRQRPKLAANGAVNPIIVKIPSRPKVSAQARAQARNLYLSAVDELAKGDSTGAIGHLQLAIHYDDSIELYRDLLAQLERSSKSGEAATDEDEGDETPALLVLRRSGKNERAPRRR
ncbi:MAG TPA: hypothetical protein VGO62_21340 [Myxococcota bacterium]